jgi:hypothetical protein
MTTESFNAREIINVGGRLGLPVRLMSKELANQIITEVDKKFGELNTWSHPQIMRSDPDIIELDLETFEFTYSERLPQERGYIFFTDNLLDKNAMVELGDIRDTCRIMDHSFGIEYFLTNERLNLLVAVNQYVIQVTGIAKSFF